MKNKKYYLLIISFILLFFVGCGKNQNKNKYTIIVTNFPCYDFVRSIIKDVDDIDVKMLIKPGTEIHDFDPTPQDIIDIKNSDLFVYVGGESEEWVNDIMIEINPLETKIVKIIDYVDLVKEELVEGMEGEDEAEEEYDEHVWTSPSNAIKIINSIKEVIKSIDEDNSSLYEENANNYIEKIENVDESIRNIVNNSKRKVLVFGDRFPFKYFTDFYNLEYYAAFSGCSDATEASAKTIAFLIDKVKSENIPVILKLELSNGNIADAIKKETGARILTLNSAHNITQKEFDEGITYVDIMKKNIEVLKEALN